MSERELAKIREALEQADRDLVAALDARAAAVRAFVALKEESPDSYFSLPSTPEVLQRAREASEGFPPEALERAMREILGACDAMVGPVKVSVPGPEGGFAQVAATRHFGSAAEVKALDSVAQVFDDVARGRASFGVVPLETSSDGAVAETVDALVQSEALICAELTIPCSYDLVSSTGNQGDVETVYGTHAALAACEQTLKRDFPKARILDVKTGPYAMGLAREDHGAAAVVASFAEGGPEGMRLVKSRVEDRAGVETRFVVVGDERPKKTGRDRTMIALAVGDEPGSLYHSLQPFAERGINLTRIESRPAHGANWRFVFILELDGHVTERPVLTAVDEVQRTSRHLKVLGSFPRPAE